MLFKPFHLKLNRMIKNFFKSVDILKYRPRITDSCNFSSSLLKLNCHGGNLQVCFS